MAPRIGTKNPAKEGLTGEMVEKLNRQAKLMEDRINIMGEECMDKNCKLCDPKLSELSNEYEDLCLDIEKLEGLLKTLNKK